MNTAATPLKLGSPEAILDRHTSRRDNGIPTVSLLVGPIGAGVRLWRRWATAAGRSVVAATQSRFPLDDWVRAVAELVDLPAAAVKGLAQRAGREPGEFVAAWQVKTPADRERFCDTLALGADDALLRLASIHGLGRGAPSIVAPAVRDLGERIVPMLLRLAPSTSWPAVLFVAGSAEELQSAGQVAEQWALRVPAVPIAVAVPAEVWDEFLAAAPDSRAKALLREGELAVPVIDPSTVERTLTEAGAAGGAAAVLAANGADAALLESAVGAARVATAPPQTPAEEDNARSAAERFLFLFLESLPETTGRFELNASLDFRFGPRPAEVDLLCRSPRVAIELDGYFHFLAPDGYRRDRTKDWELQRRGYLVLRFLAADVIPQLELVRDRILEALTVTPFGVSS